MNNKVNLGHAVWNCKYHIIWIPECRGKVLYGALRNYLSAKNKKITVLMEITLDKCSNFEHHHYP
jgi:REP element-mobilizing transposase RayT